MSFFQFQNKKVFYNVLGEGNSLLLLHGNTTSARLFDKTLKYYKDKYQIITFDFPGLGRSERLEQFPLDYWRFIAECAIALCEELGIKRLKAIGTSGGALAGLNMAVLQPELLSHLIADSFFGDYLTEQDAIRLYNRRINILENDVLAHSYWKFHNGKDWKEIVMKDLEMLLEIGKNNIPIIWGDISNIKTKVLAVATSSDGIVENILERVSECINKIPDSKTKFYDYGAHTFMITEPEEFNKIAIEFLNDDSN